jgi:predicted enzyme related to lactoylglutathione lyase
MIKLDHLEIAVDDCKASSVFYVDNLGFKVEFEVPDRKVIAIQDEFDFTIFLSQQPNAPRPRSCVLTLQVADVDALHRQLSARGVVFTEPPSRLFWGYGAELRDPSDYLVRLWDEETMRKHGTRSK